MLNVVALREYNVRVGSESTATVDYGLGDVNPCEPYNNCTHRSIVSGGALDGSRNQFLHAESSGGNAGWIYGWSATAEVDGSGPKTKGRRRVGTVRVGSIVFELNSTTGSSVVIGGAFAAADGVIDNSGSADPITVGGGALVIPEPRAATLLALALGVLAARVRSGRVRHSPSGR